MAEHRHVSRIDNHFDEASGTWVGILRVAPISLRVGVILGEAVQQYRSALDHLAYQLAILRTPNAGGPNFPIYTNRTIYTTPTGSKRESPRDRYRAIFRPDDLTLIEGVQPYNASRPNVAPLALLQQFSNLDKHETIHIGYTRIRQLQIIPEDKRVEIEVVSVNLPNTPIEDGTEVVRFRATVAEPYVEVEVEIAIRVGTYFGTKPVAGLSMFKRLAVEVVGIVDQFEQAVPEWRS